MFRLTHKKRKEVCEKCGCTPHAPRRRCGNCGLLVCVSNCWNRKLSLCKDCVSSTHPSLSKNGNDVTTKLQPEAEASMPRPQLGSGSYEKCWKCGAFYWAPPGCLKTHCPDCDPAAPPKVDLGRAWVFRTIVTGDSGDRDRCPQAGVV